LRRAAAAPKKEEARKIRFRVCFRVEQFFFLSLKEVEV
jgi:hypothetical protein